MTIYAALLLLLFGLGGWWLGGRVPTSSTARSMDGTSGPPDGVSPVAQRPTIPPVTPPPA